VALTFSPSSANVGQEVTANIVFNDDDVSWVYIDWDDGDDNSLENAIYQWYRVDSNAKTVSLTHIYTKAGTFTPIIRTVNSQGFLSKFFYRSETNVPEPKEDVGSDIANITISDTTPVGVNRVENKQVLSGIDNSIFKEGAKDVFFYKPPILVSTSNLASSSVELEVTYIDEMPQTDATTSGVIDKNDTGVSLKIRTLTGIMFDGVNNGSSNQLAALGKVKEILEVKLLTVKHTSGTNADVNDFNKQKIFLIAKSDADSLFYPITYVSNGDPIKKSSDRNVTLDFTQSRAKASNQSISKYYIDNGKVFFGPTDQRWQATSATQLTDATKTSKSTKVESYTYMTKPKGVRDSIGGGAAPLYPTFATGTAAITPSFHTQSAGAYNSDVYRSRTIANQFPLDDFNRFYDQHHLTRVNVRTAGGTNGALDTFKLVYRAAPPADTDIVAGMKLDSNALSNDYTSGSYYNAFEGGTQSPVDISNWNTTTYIGPNNNARNSTEYLLLANDVKTNKIFFNTTPFSQNYTSGSNSTSNNIAGVYYLRTGTLVDDDQFTEFAEWVPVEFTDTTKITREFRDAGNSKFTEYSDSFTKPGYVEFDMPNDWAKISASGLTGGYFNNSTSNSSLAATPYSRDITATMSNNNDANPGSPSSPYGVTTCEINVTSIGGGLNLNYYTDRQIGSFEYIYIINNGVGTADNKVFWVASGNTADNHLYLLDNGTATLSSAYSNGDNISGRMYKINAYDIFDGTFKYQSSSTPRLGMVPDYTSSNYPYTFMWDTDKATIASSFVDVYPLKIVLQGGHFSNGNTPGAELWDVLPYNNSNSQVITQKDNTAFDMSFMELTSNVNVAYAGTYYSSISKNGKVTIVRTGTPIQKITFAGNALGDEATFSFSEEYLSYNTLHKLRRMEAEGVRMMWDEKQKDGTYVRFFGVIEGVTETHSNQGPKASKPFTFTMIVDSICLITAAGALMSDITPLGGVSDGSTYS